MWKSDLWLPLQRKGSNAALCASWHAATYRLTVCVRDVLSVFRVRASQCGCGAADWFELVCGEMLWGEGGVTRAAAPARGAVAEARAKTKPLDQRVSAWCPAGTRTVHA